MDPSEIDYFLMQELADSSIDFSDIPVGESWESDFWLMGSQNQRNEYPHFKNFDTSMPLLDDSQHQNPRRPSVIMPTTSLRSPPPYQHQQPFLYQHQISSPSTTITTTSTITTPTITSGTVSVCLAMWTA